GSHTLSTASGNFVPGVTVNGVGKGTAKGASHRARVAAYKVCWPPFFLRDECDESVIMKGFEAAIHDGVDVLSISLAVKTYLLMFCPLITGIKSVQIKCDMARVAS
ncbi:subtilisin-like protease SBT5.4, partial [Tanacetum coccineum]